jgi:hypothetical protein
MARCVRCSWATMPEDTPLCLARVPCCSQQLETHHKLWPVQDFQLLAAAGPPNTTRRVVATQQSTTATPVTAHSSDTNPLRCAAVVFVSAQVLAGVLAGREAPSAWTWRSGRLSWRC